MTNSSSAVSAKACAAPIMLLSTNLARGGAEKQVALLAMALKHRDWQVHVASMIEPTAFQDELQRAGIPIHSLNMRPGRPSLLAVARFVALLRRVRPVVLHAHLFHANLLARSLRLLCPLPVVISTIHSLAESSQRSPRVGLRDRLYRLTDAYSETAVCVSDAVAARHLDAHAVHPTRHRVIWNAADAGQFHPDPEARATHRATLGLGNRFTWLAAGRLMWKKDYPTLLSAVATLPDALLLIAGDGPLRNELEHLAKELGANVRFLGLREDVPRLMQACDGFVLSSQVEGLPVVLIEAAMSGLLCVSTDAGGAREALGAGAAARVVAPQDPQALAIAMRSVMDLSPEDRLAFGAAAREDAVRRFSIDTIATEWEELYLELLERTTRQYEY